MPAYSKPSIQCQLLNTLAYLPVTLVPLLLSTGSTQSFSTRILLWEISSKALGPFHFLDFKMQKQLGVVAMPIISATQEAEAQESQVQAQIRQCTKTFSPKKKKG